MQMFGGDQPQNSGRVFNEERILVCEIAAGKHFMQIAVTFPAKLKGFPVGFTENFLIREV